MGTNKKKNGHGLMAMASQTAKMASNMIALDKTEAALDKEIEREANYKPKTKIGRARKNGENILHSKYVLLAVVILNIIDCLLVLGELMLDIKYVTDLLKAELDRNEQFIDQMKNLHQSDLSYIGPSDITALEKKILAASIHWRQEYGHDASMTSRIPENATPQSSLFHRSRRADTEQTAIGTSRNNETDTDGNIDTGHSDISHNEGHEEHHEHSIEEDIAHGLHKASITILGILVVETMFKVFCLGKQLLNHKLECFDVVIVIASFAVDLAFLKGLQQFTVQDFVLILSFMVPWRIIRVVNSLVVAIMDHEHFRLILLYKQKKKVVQQLEECKDDAKGLQACIDALAKMCGDAGVPDKYVKAKLNMYRKVKAKSGAIGAISSYAMGGDTMLKPFANTKSVDSELKSVVVPIEPAALETNGSTGQDSKQMETLEMKETPDSEKTQRKKNHYGKLDSRPRSRSAVEPGQATNSPLVKRLAGNSATFIATINKDSVEDLRVRRPVSTDNLIVKLEAEEPKRPKSATH